MLTKLALAFVLHVIALGILFARKPAYADLRQWKKPAVYAFVFYVFWGVLLSLRPGWTVPF